MKTEGQISAGAAGEQQVLPHGMNFDGGMRPDDFIKWYKAHTAEIDNMLLDKGAVLFQGVGITSVADFEHITSSIASRFRTYMDGSYPRRKLKGHVYISTEYDPNYDITMHNELSYSVKWPSRLFFSCIVPPAAGGETPLADSRRILQQMNPSLLEEFERKQIRYIRNLHAGEGLGPSWQEVFETTEKEVVQQYCEEAAIRYHWKENGGLKLVQVRPATAIHPVTGERVWFNQVDQFHPSHFNREIYDTLMFLADYQEEELPLYVSFGDGSGITEEIVQEVQNAINKVLVIRPWQQSDFIIVDNMLVAHGRKAYKGERQIVVSMS